MPTFCVHFEDGTKKFISDDNPEKVRELVNKRKLTHEHGPVRKIKLLRHATPA